MPSNNGGVYSWSQTSNSNANSDSTVNWAEGMAPSAVNDSARAMMSSVAKYRDDISGAIVTGGTSTAYTVASNQQFDTLAHMGGQIIAFTPHVTNTAGSPNVTLNVDGLGVHTLRADPANELLPGMLVAGTPYVALYSFANGVFYLQGFYGNPYNVPLASGFDFWGPTAPNSSFAFPIGQAISRTTYAPLFGLVGTTYGVGDGSTTFNLPDKRGRTSVAADASAGRVSTATLTALTPGGTGGAEVHALTLGEIPTITSVNASFGISVVNTGGAIYGTRNGASSNGGGSGVNQYQDSNITSTGTVGSGTVVSTSQGTGGGSHTNMQPTIVCNYIIRIL